MSDKRYFTIIDNKKVAPQYFLMKIRAPEIAQKGKPGQFVHVKVIDNNIYDPLLRRPFSFFDIEKDKNLIKLVYEIVGKGTKIMSGLSAGDKVNLLGPLGNGFNLNHKNQVVIGGGMGIVPLYYLVKSFLKKGEDPEVYIGGNKKEDILFFIKKFKKLSVNLSITTMNNSIGDEGNVIDLWYKNLEYQDKNKVIFSCGPEKMLSTLQIYAEKYQIQGEVSLEARMGCGIGVCLSCVCKTKSGNKRVCKEGPVFALDEVIFDENPQFKD